jgi:hypothetical protein
MTELRNLFYPAQYLPVTTLLVWLILGGRPETDAAFVYIADLVAVPGVTSNVTGRAIVFGESNLIGFAGYGINVEKSLSDLSCNQTNACGAHIHDGTGCDSLPKQGELLYGAPISTNPWTEKRYSSDATGFGRFGDVIDVGAMSVKDKTFIRKLWLIVHPLHSFL